ncbi:MAG: DUF3084 domain-containing protein [Armatimonadetes bacterium]|nr:DUF3084 domain-containing protein [Armatimonadota bacterium]
MLLFALVLLVAGGAIAYMGDRLGTYIGKKRLSSWGLRPRHTAMLWTVISGGLIAVLTLFALIGYDRAIQTALLRGPELLEENHQLAQQNQEQRLLIRSREAQVQTADARAAAAQTSAGQAEQRAQQATRRAQDALQKALDAEGRLGRSLHRLQVARSDLARSRDALRRRQAVLAAAQRRLADVRSSLGSTRIDLRAAWSRLRVAQLAVKDADRNVRVAQAQYGLALGTVTELSEQGKQLSARNADLTQQNAALEDKNQQLLTQTTFLQGAHLIYHRGQEVGRRVIPTGLSADTVRQNLLAFLGDLSRDAEREGAGRGEDGRAVRVVADAGGGKAISEDEALDSLAQSIAQQAVAIPGVVVIASARYNAFGGEPVQIEVQPYDNVLVFPKGAFIGSATVDGSLPENQILDVLQAFLKDRVQPEARRQGIIPRPDPLTGLPTVGEPTDPARTVALVKQIQKIGPGALVTARAAADTYSSGPLRLDLTASAPPAAPSAVRS